MDHQTAFNILIGIISAMLGWWLNNVWLTINELRRIDKELAEKVASIEVLVAGEYVTRDEFNNVMGQVFNKLDRIMDAVSKKADR
jgi:hypothetical protein